MGTRLLLDTGVVIGAASQNDQWHESSRRLIELASRARVPLLVCSGLDYDRVNASAANRELVDRWLAVHSEIVTVNAPFRLDVSQLDADGDLLMDDADLERISRLDQVLMPHLIDLHHASAALLNSAVLVTTNVRDFIDRGRRERLRDLGLVVMTPEEAVHELEARSAPIQMLDPADAAAGERTPYGVSIGLSHVAYELAACVEGAYLCREVTLRTEPGTESMRNAYLESCLLHARSLLEFFLSGSRRQDDMRPEDFGPPWTPDPGPVGDSAQRLSDSRVLFNKHLAHLSWARVDGEPEQEWFFIQIACDVFTLTAAWCRHLETSHRDAPWREPMVLREDVEVARTRLLEIIDEPRTVAFLGRIGRKVDPSP